MKNILIIALSFLITNLKSQSFSISYDSISATIETSDKLHNDMVNTDSTQIQVTWKITGHDFPSDWAEGLAICDNKLCYTNGSNNYLLNGNAKTTLAINSSDTASFYVWPTLNGASSGTHYIKINMEHNATSIDSWYIITKTTTGITYVKRADVNIHVFPNPATEALNLGIEPNSNARTIEILNLQGHLVQSGVINTKLDVEKLPVGSYLINFLNEGRELVGKAKFQKK